MTRALLASTVLAAGLLAGCNNYDGTGSLTRQEGDIHTNTPPDQERVTSPVLGETTGQGQKIDSRTGARISGKDLSGADAEKAAPVVPAPTTRPVNQGPIPTNSGAGANPNLPR